MMQDCDVVMMKKIGIGRGDETGLCILLTKYEIVLCILWKRHLLIE